MYVEVDIHVVPVLYYLNRRDLYKEGISVHIIEPGYFATNMTNPDNLVLLLQEAYNRCDPEVKEYYGKGYVEQGEYLQ